MPATQKIPKAANVCQKALRWNSTPAEAGATKTSRFLIHWRGRAEASSPTSTVRARHRRVTSVFVGSVHSFSRSGQGVLGRFWSSRGRRREGTTDPSARS